MHAKVKILVNFTIYVVVQRILFDRLSKIKSFLGLRGRIKTFRWGSFPFYLSERPEMALKLRFLQEST